MAAALAIAEPAPDLPKGSKIITTNAGDQFKDINNSIIFNRININVYTKQAQVNKSHLDFFQNQLSIPDYQPDKDDLAQLTEIEKENWKEGSDLRAYASLTLAFGI